MNVKQLLKQHSVILLLEPGASYNEICLDVIKKLKGNKILYITMNKTHSALLEHFKKAKIPTKEIVFIDAISSAIHVNTADSKQCLHCPSPAALGDLDVAIDKMLKKGVSHVVLDSVSNLLIYNKKASINRFLSNLANRLRDHRVKGIFHALKSDANQDLVQQVGLFVDTVVALE